MKKKNKFNKKTLEKMLKTLTKEKFIDQLEQAGYERYEAFVTYKTMKGLK